MTFDLNTRSETSKSKYEFPKTLLKSHFLRQGSISFLIKLKFTENCRLIFSWLLVSKLAFVSYAEFLSYLGGCQSRCFPKTPQNWQNKKLFIWLLSGSVVFGTIGSGVAETTAVLARSVDALPEGLSAKSLRREKTEELPCFSTRKLPDSEAIISSKANSCEESLESLSLVSFLMPRSRLAPPEYLVEPDPIVVDGLLSNASSALQNKPDIATKELALSIQNQNFIPASPVGIPLAVSLRASNLSLSNTGIDIEPIAPNLTTNVELPKTPENFSSPTSIALLSQVPQIQHKQTDRQQSNPSSSPDSNAQFPSTEEESEPPNAEIDPDLGRLRLRERRVPTRQPQPVLHIIPRISYFYTTNVFSGVDPVKDSLYFPSLTLWSTPKLGPSTYLIASVDGNLIRYLNESEFDYNLVGFRTGIYQRLNSRMAGEIGWNDRQYFRASNGERFLDEHFIYLTLSRRDWLNRRLALDSFYDVRLSFANPDNRSRLINYLSVSLSYYFQRNLQVGMDYQFSFSDFTKTDREDYYHRLLGRLSYGVSKDSQINVQGGVTIGDSTDANLDFDSLFFSVTYSVDLKVF